MILDLANPQRPHHMVGYGHWVVNGHGYFNKLRAFENAYSTGHYPHWDFYEEDFNRHDWTKEPTANILDLYSARARQIRENNDFIILMLSGGCDSWTMADSFVRAGLKIDEIWVFNPASWADPDPNNRSSENMCAETWFAGIPEAKKFIERDPRIQLRVIDTADEMVKFWKQNETIDILGSVQWFTPELGPRLSPTVTYNSNIPKTARKVRLQGIDKPRIIYENGKFYMVFLDVIATSRLGLNKTLLGDPDDYDQVFYWHPDAAQVLIKQGHLVKNWFKQHPEFLHLLEDRKKTPAETELCQTLINKIVYPSYDFSIWQAKKDFKGQFDYACYDKFNRHPDDPGVQSWRNTVKRYSDTVYDLYAKHNKLEDTVGPITNENWYYALPGCFSKRYDLGT